MHHCALGSLQLRTEGKEGRQKSREKIKDRGKRRKVCLFHEVRKGRFSNCNSGEKNGRGIIFSLFIVCFLDAGMWRNYRDMSPVQR